MFAHLLLLSKEKGGGCWGRQWSQEYTTTYLCNHLTSLGKCQKEVHLLKLAMSTCLAWTWVSHLSHWAAIKRHLRSAWSSQHRAWFLPPKFSGSSGLRLRQETVLCRKRKVSTDLCPSPLSTLTNTVLGGDNAVEQFSSEIMREKEKNAFRRECRLLWMRETKSV